MGEKDVYGDEEIEENNKFGGDMGEPVVYILQKLLYSFKTPLQFQRSAIFKTRCSIKLKYVKL